MEVRRARLFPVEDGGKLPPQSLVYIKESEKRRGLLVSMK